MAENTRYVKYQLDSFFQSVDKDIEHALGTQDFEYHRQFLNRYTREFPTLGEMFYQHIFASTGLNNDYEDYTLQQPLKEGDPEIEKKRRAYPDGKKKPFYIYYYHKHILNKVKPMAESGVNQELKSFLDHWQEKLEKQGFVFQYNTKESVTVRNIAFHMAFALEMDVKSLKDVLTKCLLQRGFNPKDHMECICWYCLKNGIPYDRMRSEYLDYYRSDAFDETYRGALEKGIANINTQMLGSRLEEMVNKSPEDFFRYLWQLKYTENLVALGQKTEFGKVPDDRALKRKTPGEVYWENICYFVDEEDPDTLQNALTEEEYAVRFPQIWQKARRDCYERNRDPLMDRQTLALLFGNIDYSKRGIEKRKWTTVDMSRTEIIATQFIAHCTRSPDKKTPRTKLRSDFLKEIKEDLEVSGLRRFYVRAPFELFIALCFLHEDPLCFFLASWEAATTEP